MEKSASSSELETQQLMQSLAQDACLSLFDAYGVKIEPHELAAAPSGEHAMTSIVGFTGKAITGMCLVASSEEPLLASNPGGSLRDWLAELSNQLAGRLKHKLLAQGLEVYITTPIVLRATRIEPMPRREQLKPLGFRTAEGGTLALWVEVEIGPGFEMVPTAAGPAMEEGEALLF